MAKKNKEIKQLTEDWHDSVVDDTPDKKFVPKGKKAKAVKEEADFNTHNLYEDNAQSNWSDYANVPLPPAPEPEFIWTKDVSKIHKILAVNDTLNGTLYKGKPK